MYRTKALSDKRVACCTQVKVRPPLEQEAAHPLAQPALHHTHTHTAAGRRNAIKTMDPTHTHTHTRTHTHTQVRTHSNGKNSAQSQGLFGNNLMSFTYLVPVPWWRGHPPDHWSQAPLPSSGPPISPAVAKQCEVLMIVYMCVRCVYVCVLYTCVCVC